MIGQSIGVVTDNFEVTNDKGQEVKLSVKFDFSNTTDQDIRSWLCGNRRIALQRVLRPLSTGEIEALNGTTVRAENAGRKVKSWEEQVADLVSAGMPRKAAELAVSNPGKFKELMDNIE